MKWRTNPTYNSEGILYTHRAEDLFLPDRIAKRDFGGPIPLHDGLNFKYRHWTSWNWERARRDDHHSYTLFYDYNMYGGTTVYPGSVVASDQSGSAYVVFTRVAPSNEASMNYPVGELSRPRRDQRTEQVGYSIAGACFEFQSL